MYQVHTKVEGCLYFKYTQRWRVVCVSSTHKGRGLFVYQVHTKVEGCLCIKFTQR